MRLFAATIAAALLSAPARADDNAIAFRLFEQGRYAEAAEIFTDPAWKGTALYRSSQWWRAAEAFVRASDAASMHNLGNTYVKLGYPALALDAYQATLAIDPDFEDARFNAELMKQVLAKQQENRGQKGLRPKAKEIDRVESEPDEEGSNSSAGNKDADRNKQKASGSEQGENRQEASESFSNESSGGENRNDEKHDERPENAEASVKGAAADTEAEKQTVGGSEATDETHNPESAGFRVKLEQDQATEQWLNAIRDDPAAFLGRRIALEMRRRKATGTLPEGKHDPW